MSRFRGLREGVRDIADQLQARRKNNQLSITDQIKLAESGFTAQRTPGPFGGIFGGGQTTFTRRPGSVSKLDLDNKILQQKATGTTPITPYQQALLDNRSPSIAESKLLSELESGESDLPEGQQAILARELGLESFERDAGTQFGFSQQFPFIRVPKTTTAFRRPEEQFGFEKPTTPFGNNANIEIPATPGGRQPKFLNQAELQNQRSTQFQQFSSVEEAERANLPKGTIVLINGERAIVE